MGKDEDMRSRDNQYKVTVGRSGGGKTAAMGLAISEYVRRNPSATIVRCSRDGALVEKAVVEETPLLPAPSDEV